jgi:putative OPT family oligopeptide transporter
MAAPAAPKSPTTSQAARSQAAAPPEHQPYVPDSARLPEFTWPAVVVGALLGIVFGASSLYLVLKVGLTVSASIPVAVLSITLFRIFSKVFGIRRATILENNIVQTTGSAGESIAFGVGVTLPALMLLGFDMDVVRVMTVGILGGLLGILMMIPLRRAFIVRQHHKLPYPEGTACADVLIVGEQGGATAATVFGGFGVAFVYKFVMKAMHLWNEEASQELLVRGHGLKRGVLGGEFSPELLGVGYIIGPKIGSVMMSGGVLAYLILTPMIAMFGDGLPKALAPATEKRISEMSVGDIRENYILYIGAGAVATGGIISMLQAMPMIIGSLAAGLREIRGTKDKNGGGPSTADHRTERDLPLSVVVVGSLGLVLALAAVPNLGLGFNIHGLVGATLVVLFGFLFVTVSSRLTGLIGSSSNPISGMTVATLLLTCLVFLAMGKTDKAATLTALTIAAVVCIAASNGGTTAQDLKTGYLVGATPRAQQLAILVGALTSALVMGVTLILLNDAGTIYTKRPEYLTDHHVPNVAALTQTERVGGEYGATDETLYHVWHVREGEIAGVKQGKYLADDTGKVVYLVDPAINGRVLRMTDDGKEHRMRDNGEIVGNSFDAPKTKLMALIIDGILGQKLPWELVILGALIAVVMELVGVPSLPFAVGVYLPIQTSLPIFLGGIIRWSVDRVKARPAGESEMSPGVLLSSGYIAGGAIAGVFVAFLEFAPQRWRDALSFSKSIERMAPNWYQSNWPTLIAFAVLVGILVVVGMRQINGKVKQPA